MLAEGLAARGVDVTVLVTNTARSTRIERRANLRIVRAGRALHLASTPLSWRMISQAARLRADLVHLHMPYPPGDLVARALPGNPPLIVTYHSDIVRQRRLLQIYRPLLHATLRRARAIIATSAPYVTSSPFLRRYADTCRIVPLSVDVDRFGSVSAERIVALRRRFLRSSEDRLILSVGVLRYYKGLHVLIDAIARTNATLLIVGGGPEEQRLRDQARALGIADRVHLAGRVDDDDLPTYFGAADVFVLASHLRAEAFGIVQLEALASGLPIVSTELGTGTSVVNRHGTTGFVVPPSDPAALARAIDVLCANDDLRRWMGARAQALARAEYNHDQMIDHTLAVYREVLDRNLTT